MLNPKSTTIRLIINLNLISDYLLKIITTTCLNELGIAYRLKCMDYSFIKYLIR